MFTRAPLGFTTALMIVGAWAPARADPEAPVAWYGGEDGHKRLLHLTITAAVGAAWIASETILKPSADKHYLSDVLVGSAVGFATGMHVPRMMRPDIKIVPTANGAAIVGTF